MSTSRISISTFTSGRVIAAPSTAQPSRGSPSPQRSTTRSESSPTSAARPASVPAPTLLWLRSSATRLEQRASAGSSASGQEAAGTDREDSPRRWSWKPDVSSATSGGTDSRPAPVEEMSSSESDACAADTAPSSTICMNLSPIALDDRLSDVSVWFPASMARSAAAARSPPFMPAALPAPQRERSSFRMCGLRRTASATYSMP